MMATPVLIHTHGIGPVDYSTMGPSDLDLVQKEAENKGLSAVLGIFLTRARVGAVGELMKSYWDRREELPNILGFSIEGPLLGNVGGVPPAGIWAPNVPEWKAIADMGSHGLQYVVMAPDGGDLDEQFGDSTNREIIDLFYSNGVRLALGHFQHSAPSVSARRTKEVIDYVQEVYGPGPDVLLTDHLFNDMPRAFKHVWRTPEEQQRRLQDLEVFTRNEWTPENLTQTLGEVPAVLVEAARAGKLLPFLNFDGDHVDLEVCRMALNYLGAEKIIGITDDTETTELAGEDLHHRQGSGLWYRSDGVVAAGTGHLDKQIVQLEFLGCNDKEIEKIFRENPLRALEPIRSRSAVAVS
ncbi:MAG: hypothetical protein J0I04_19070 [Paenarthrobacter ureafaciens]|uniref:hypothetical protein n=1 Tax=Paenarthrobacter ureafaciens TaxID=37931 RepID=UPI001AD532EF|nr:hypothetical protein [Paenarthrobacter ureafaciens]MBN9131740.1 hypothetical protein [Paenarthrobacter ureafaciens]